MFTRLLCLLSLLLLPLTYAFMPDDTDIKMLNGKLEKFRKTYPQEKVHLHTDKPYYSIGDTIYFKAYVVNAEKNTPSVVSNILYVDMIDDSNHIKQTLRLPVMDGTTWGTVALADSLREGNYKIRAYTNWMRNFDEAYFFNKMITIGNGLNSDWIASASFKPNSAGNKNEDTVTIQYSSLYGLPVAGKEVSYNIVSNKKEIAKGKGSIDNEGKLSIGLESMQNNQSPAVLLTHLKVNKTVVTKELMIKVPAAQYKTQFFPEGGQMVAGLPARIGFKAMGNDGLGIAVSGKITDDSSAVSVPFQSGFAGIGSFGFTPISGHTYHALIKYKDGSEEKVMLPAAAVYGYVLNIDNTEADKVGINIASKQSTPADKVILVAQCNNRMVYAAPLALSNGSASISLSKKKFPTGIVQFTLFNPALQPVAERLAFINHHDALTIDMRLDKAAYNRREKVKMILDVKDQNGDPVTGTFSLSVTDANTVVLDKAKQQTILTDLLLTSDLKGYIESPNHYFTDADDASVKELDDLLLTQGWRRFIWQDILTDKYHATPFVVEKSLSISGKVLTPRGAPVAGGSVTFISKKGSGFTLNTTTSEDGSFAFDELNLTDNNPFVVQATTAKGSSDVVIKMNDFSPPSINNNEYFTNVNYAPDSSMLNYLIHSRHRYDEMRKNGLLNDNSFTLKEVTVTTQKFTKIQKIVAPSMNLNGPGNADQILTYEDLGNCPDLARCLPGKALGVVVNPYLDPVTKYRSLQPFSTRRMSNKPMLVILDGIEMNTGSFSLTSIYGKDVQSVELLRSGGFLSVYGLRGSEGVMVITTKKGGDFDYNDVYTGKEPIDNAVKGTLFTTAMGYSSSREFYSPDYSSPVVNNTMPDLRSTIYWQPNVVTDDNGKATIEFYNGDVAGTYNVIIEGISGNGEPGYATFTYEVK